MQTYMCYDLYSFELIITIEYSRRKSVGRNIFQCFANIAVNFIKDQMIRN